MVSPYWTQTPKSLSFQIFMIKVAYTHTYTSTDNKGRFKLTACELNIREMVPTRVICLLIAKHL